MSTEPNEAEDLAREEDRLNQDDPRFEVAILGRSIELWVDENPIGQYVVSRAREELEEVKEQLLTETDGEKIKALQARAAVCNRVRQWLGEAVQAGQAAAQSLQHERDGAHDQ